MKKGMMECCMGHKGMGLGMLILGGLVLGNIYWFMLSWPMFVGWVLVLAGFVKMLMPNK